MEQYNYGKIKKAAVVFRMIIRILFWALIVIGVVLIVAEVVICMIPEKYFILSDFFKGDLTLGIEGIFEYEFAQKLSEELLFKPALLVVLPTIVLNIIFYLINFRQVQSILKTVIEDRPFAMENSRSLYIMGITFLVGSFVLKLATNFVFIKIFAMFGGQGLKMDYIPNLTMIFTGVLLIILSSVFKYGNYLQEEFDETV